MFYILTILLSFFTLIVSHRFYDQQRYLNGQTYSRGQSAHKYSQLSYPIYNNQQSGGFYGSLKSGSIYNNGRTSDNLELVPKDKNQRPSNSLALNFGELEQEPERTNDDQETFTTSQVLTVKQSEALKAVAVLTGKAKGILYFEQIDDKVHITGKIEGLTNGLHAFHVHDFGDLSRSCESSGDHFNPYKTKHGSPSESVRHVGDLGNVFADESGEAKIDIQDKFMSLREGKNNIIGHTIIVHESVDDLGRGGHVKSGRRVGCGIIGWRNDLA